MPLFENWPYSNFHELNLDWILQQVKDLTEKVESLDKQLNEDLDAYIEQYINDHLADLLLSVVYDAADTAIVFSVEEV